MHKSWHMSIYKMIHIKLAALIAHKRDNWKLVSKTFTVTSQLLERYHPCGFPAMSA